METEINELSEDEKILLLKVLMIDIRTDWNSPKNRINIITYLCSIIKTLPTEFLDAVIDNAINFDGHFIDGRVFRDGQMYLDEDIVDSLGLPEGMKYGVSGNIAKLIGAKNKKTPYKYRGTYKEIEKWCKLPDKFRPRSNTFKIVCKYYLENPEWIFNDFNNNEKW